MAGAPEGQHNGCRKEPFMANRKYTREFKLSAVGLVNQQGYTITEAAKSLGVDPANVRFWVKQYSSEPGLTPRGRQRRSLPNCARRTPAC